MFGRETAAEKAARMAKKQRRASEDARDYNRRMIAKIWRKKGEAGFIVVPSAEGATASPSQIKNLRPAQAHRPTP